MVMRRGKANAAINILHKTFNIYNNKYNKIFVTD